MTSDKVQLKLRQLVFLHAQHSRNQGAKIPVDQEKIYQQMNRDYEQGYMTLADIDSDIAEYLSMRKTDAP